MQKQERALEILARLNKAYPRAECALVHRNPYQLLVATILSAQCTDERVNMVTPPLFRRFPDPAAMAKAAPEAIEELIRSTGFYRNKAKSILGASRRIVEEYGGRVPDAMEELLTLPGVARKTANVVLGTAFAQNEGVVVDTHVHRLSNRMGLTRERVPEKIERNLMKLFPREEWTDLSHRMITHGRLICNARLPKCGQCVMGPDICPSYEPDPQAWKKRKAKRAGTARKAAVRAGKKTAKKATKKSKATAAKKRAAPARKKTAKRTKAAGGKTAAKKKTGRKSAR